MTCPGCGWVTSWRLCFKSIQHKQLSGAQPVIELFQGYMRRLPLAEGPREKMLRIDALIHGFHWSLRNSRRTRTTAVNLIEGKYHDGVDFLDRLSYGEHSTLGTREVWIEWRERISVTAKEWNDDRLRRPPQDPTEVVTRPSACRSSWPTPTRAA